MWVPGKLHQMRRQVQDKLRLCPKLLAASIFSTHEFSESVLQDRTRGKPQEVKPMASSRPILAAIHFLSCFPTFRHMTTHMRREDFKVFRCFKSISVALVHLWTLLFKETFNYQLFEGRCSVKANKGRFWGLWEVIMGWRSGTQQRFQIDCRHNQPHIRAWMMLSVNICDTKNFSMCSGLVTTTAHCTHRVQ